MPDLARFLLSLAGAGLALGTAGCVAQVPAAGVQWRVIVRLVQPSSDTDAVARLAAQTSGVTVRYAAAVSPERHALVLSCADEARCDEAVRRLQRDTAHFQSVQRDERRRLHGPASSSTL